MRILIKYVAASSEAECGTHCNVSPKGPTNTARPRHVTRTASFPHHSTWSTSPDAPATPVVSNSAKLRWKSVDTTQRSPENVRSASDLPFGEGDMCVKGPRDMRWSRFSRLSTLYIVDSTESRTSTCREMVWSGGMTVQDCGGWDKPASQLVCMHE